MQQGLPNLLKKGSAEIAAELTGSRAKEPLSGSEYLTSNFGHTVPSSKYAINVQGYPLVNDVFLFEKQQTFNRSKTVERMVHPCGSGAFGYFEVTNDISSLTKASFLKEIGKRTPVFVRFSTTTFGKEFPDLARNPRGFAIKFYTEDGNYDIVGLNFPVFFVRDPMQGPDAIRSQQRDPKSFVLNWDGLFDFLSNVPESMHAATMQFSNYGTPYSWRFMNGYGCHTFKWVNAEGESHYVKYHFISEQGTKNLTNLEAQEICGIDPDHSKRDLFNHIEKGGKACWRAYYQLMTENQAKEYEYDPFDVTKVWYRKDFPMKEFGRLVLNRNPENYHRDVEQAAFSPGSLVPGIEPSPDSLLNWRLFFYRDTQYYRLGVNLHEIPVNCPFLSKQFNPQSRDGTLRTDTNGEALPPYQPTGKQNVPRVNPEVNWKKVQTHGIISRVNNYKHEGQDSEHDQVRELIFRVMNEDERDQLYKNIGFYLKYCQIDTIYRFLALCYKIKPEYATGIISNMEEPTIKIDKIQELASIANYFGHEMTYTKV